MSTQETAKTLFLTADGIDFAYRLIGKSNSSQPPLLMLNHVRSTIDTWDPDLINNLTATGRQLITYDYAGLGHSRGPVATSIKGFAINLLAFLNVLLLKLSVKEVDVLGFSMGGYIAQQLVCPMNEVQSTVFSPAPGPATIDAFFPLTTGDEGASWFNRSTSSRAGVAGKDGEPEIALFTTGKPLLNLAQAYLSWDADPLPYALLQTIQKDALVTCGDNDLIVPTQNSFVLARQLSRANFVMFPSSGHGHLFQYAGYYAGLVGSFLDGDLPSAPFSAGEVPRLE
ncbi:Alpha/Beta hydrolase protein [Fusarium oxysporum]|nr:Alpha/Beta hydrolase protein [Fusarium oxysporum]